MDVYGPVICVIAGLVAVIEILRIHSRLGQVEAMLARLLSHLNVDLDPSIEPSETVKLLAADRKSYVKAIKAYREQTGLGLQPAKAVVDRLVADNRARATASRLTAQ